MFKYSLLIKDKVFINYLQSYWIRHYVFDWFIRLISIKVFYFLCHRISAYSHFIGSARLFYQSQEDVAFFVWYLWFGIYWQYFLFLTLALNLLPFCLLMCSFTALRPHFRVKVLLFPKHSSLENSSNKAQFRKFCKRLSIYPLFIRCVQETEFY